MFWSNLKRRVQMKHKISEPLPPEMAPSVGDTLDLLEETTSRLQELKQRFDEIRKQVVKQKEDPHVRS